MLRKVALLATSLGLAPALGCAPYAPSPSPTQIPTSAPTTTVIVFSPAGVEGQGVKGYCWTGSVAVWRPNAWRCMEGNRIHDPCFSSDEKATSVICVRDPTGDGKGIQMNLTRPLPTQERLPQGSRAWFLVLQDGTKCGFLQGATAGINQRRLNYGCSDGWYILGDPVPDQVCMAEKVLLSRTAKEPTAEQSLQVDIKTVWL